MVYQLPSHSWIPATLWPQSLSQDHQRVMIQWRKQQGMRSDKKLLGKHDLCTAGHRAVLLLPPGFAVRNATLYFVLMYVIFLWLAILACENSWCNTYEEVQPISRTSHLSLSRRPLIQEANYTCWKLTSDCVIILHSGWTAVIRDDTHHEAYQQRRIQHWAR